MSLTMRVRTQIPQPEAALEPVDGTRARARARRLKHGPRRPPSEKTHTMVVSFHRGAQLRAVCLDPPDAPIEDIVADASPPGATPALLFFAGERRDARGGDGAARRGARARAADAHGRSRVSAQVGVGSTTAPGSRPWTCLNGRSTARAYGLWASPAWRRRLWLPPRRASTPGYASVAAALRATEDASQGGARRPRGSPGHCVRTA